MDTNKKKEKNIKSYMTFYEFGILFLKSKYGRISFKSYGTYQNRIKVINEFMGNYILSDITINDLISFKNYLKEKRMWKYTFNVSDYSIKMIIDTLNELLSKAVKWNLIKDNPNNNYKKVKKSNNIILNNIQLESEKRRVVDNLERILYNIE